MKIHQKQQNWHTAGQAGAKNLLSNFLNGDNLTDIPHAFLFLGPSGVGKYLLAREFAEKISATGANSSEIMEFDFAESGSVENLRELISLSSLTTSAGSKKIFILKNFDLASPSSSNVMLKTLEEPPASSMFLLVANANRVLPTVMSRCITIRCFPVMGLDVKSKLPKTLITIVEQYPELLVKLENNPEQAQLLSDLLEKLQSHNLSLVNLNNLVELEPDDLKLFIKLWIHSLKQDLSATKADLPNILHNLRVAQDTNEDLKRSYNTKLVLQQFLIQTK